MRPSKTKIKEILNQSVFDPRKPGPYSIIMESGIPDYLIQRAIEMLREALEMETAHRDAKITAAISLLAMSKVKEEIKEEVKYIQKKKRKEMTLDGTSVSVSMEPYDQSTKSGT